MLGLRKKSQQPQQLPKKSQSTRLFPASPAVQAGAAEKTSKDFELLIKKPIGTGAFAQVYLVRHKKTKDRFAIKMMRKKII